LTPNSAHRIPFTASSWQVTCDATTPVVLLRDLHAELLDLYLEDRHSDRNYLFRLGGAPHEAYAPMLTCGWSHDVKTDGTQVFLAPKGLGGVRRRYNASNSSGPLWRYWGGHPNEPLWQACFSSNTPTALVAAFTASLISTEPLERTVRNVPTSTRRALYVASPAGKQSLVGKPVAPRSPVPAPGHSR
jgi:hypothetical protein